MGVLTSHVHSIVMSSNGMEGKIPGSISQLSYLRMIELATMPGKSMDTLMCFKYQDPDLPLCCRFDWHDSKRVVHAVNAAPPVHLPLRPHGAHPR